MTITGHKTESVYRHHDIVTQDDVKAAVTKIEGRNPVINYVISSGALKIGTNRSSRIDLSCFLS